MVLPLIGDPGGKFGGLVFGKDSIACPTGNIGAGCSENLAASVYGGASEETELKRCSWFSTRSEYGGGASGNPVGPRGNKGGCNGCRVKLPLDSAFDTRIKQNCFQKTYKLLT